MPSRTSPPIAGRFPKTVRPALTLLAALVLCFSQARAGDDDVEEDEPTHSFTQSISLSPLLFLGSLYANYEYLLGMRHGLLAEGSYSAFGPSSGSWGMGAGYRFHFSPGLEGLFAGAFLRTGFVTTEVPIEEDGEKTTYDLESSLTLVGANLGYRWQWGSGIALSLRGGYGLPLQSDFTWSPADPEEEGIKGFVEATMGLDLELSAGYSF